MGQQVCAPWTTADTLCNEGDGTTADCAGGTVPLIFPWSDDELVLAASNILYARTCFRYPGVCSFAVWPCVLGSCWSKSHPCLPCTPGAIQLPTDLPVVNIVSITEDGVTLDPSAYRLESGGTIRRLDGLRWQRNTFGLDDVSGVDLRVTYRAGVAPPIELQMAAADLAAELKKSCNGQSCAIDPRVQSFARRGVSVELTDLEDLLKSGATGIPSVDHALAVHGDCSQGTATMMDPAARYRGTRVIP